MYVWRFWTHCLEWLCSETLLKAGRLTSFDCHQQAPTVILPARLSIAYNCSRKLMLYMSNNFATLSNRQHTDHAHRAVLCCPSMSHELRKIRIQGWCWDRPFSRPSLRFREQLWLHFCGRLVTANGLWQAIAEKIRRSLNNATILSNIWITPLEFRPHLFEILHD